MTNASSSHRSPAPAFLSQGLSPPPPRPPRSPPRLTRPHSLLIDPGALAVLQAFRDVTPRSLTQLFRRSQGAPQRVHQRGSQAFHQRDSQAFINATFEASRRRAPHSVVNTVLMAFVKRTPHSNCHTTSYVLSRCITHSLW